MSAVRKLTLSVPGSATAGQEPGPAAVRTSQLLPAVCRGLGGFGPQSLSPKMPHKLPPPPEDHIAASHCSIMSTPSCEQSTPYRSALRRLSFPRGTSFEVSPEAPSSLRPLWHCIDDCRCSRLTVGPSREEASTGPSLSPTWTVFQQDGPNHLGLSIAGKHGAVALANMELIFGFVESFARGAEACRRPPPCTDWTSRHSAALSHGEGEKRPWRNAHGATCCAD